MTTTHKRLAIIAILAGCLSPLALGQSGPAKDAPKIDFFKGKVVPLAEALGAKVDDDANWMVLAGDDGKIYPLVKDNGSRLFYKDKRLLRRPMRLTARLTPGSTLLQVVQTHSYHKGQLHEVYYWCDICTIRGFQPGICDCCGDPMELRETPAKE